MSFLTELQAFEDRPLDLAQWERLQRNCRRVLYFGNDTDRGQIGLEPKSKRLICDLYTGQPLFPKLKVLHLSDDCLDAMFMSNTVEEMNWRFDTDLVAEESSYLKHVDDIGGIMANIRRLSLHAEDIIENHGDVLAQLLLQLPFLEWISIPRYTSTPSIIGALATRPHIDTILSNPPPDPVGIFGNVADRHFTLRWTEESLGRHWPYFSRIRVLSISLPYLDYATTLFQQSSSPGDLLEFLEIFIAFPRDARKETIRMFFETVVKRCSRLRTLDLSMVTASGIPSDVEAAVEGQFEAIDYRVMEPLLDSKSLIRLYVRHTYPVDMSDDDAGRFARRWPQGEALILNQRPSVHLTPTQTLKSVLHFARGCPRMVTLGLYVNGNLYADPGPDAAFSPDFTVLDLGVSPFPLRGRGDGLYLMAKFIATVLPHGSKILTGVNDFLIDSQDFRPAAGEDDLDADGLTYVDFHTLDAYDDGWRCVQRMARAFRMVDGIVPQPGVESWRQILDAFPYDLENDEYHMQRALY